MIKNIKRVREKEKQANNFFLKKQEIFKYQNQVFAKPELNFKANKVKCKQNRPWLPSGLSRC